ncbi:hypothetical protein DER44DRAFT_795752 [Fusarium oxysporum]|nr:hypothetical protein DER44DRAFT_795752 [Fusarium oxysporum]
MTPISHPEGGSVDCILDVTDNGLSQNRAAQKRGFPQTTLSDRLRGMPSRTEVTQTKWLSMAATVVPTAPSSSSCMLMNACSKKRQRRSQRSFPSQQRL